MSEIIKLDDFVAEVKKFDKQFAKNTKPTYSSYTQCPTCKETQHLTVKFCPNDGQKLELIKYETRSKEAQDAIRRLFNDLAEGHIYDGFPYEFVDTFETYDDDHSGDKYFISFILKRKSDGKHFEFTMDSWDELGGDSLCEVEKKTKTITTWE